jgi:ribosomal-protein-alanine N-acetyltransferase
MPLPLETERLLVRPFTMDDLDELHENVLSDDEVMRWASPHRRAATREESREALERYIGEQQRAGFSFWAVVERETQTLVGNCGLIPYAWEGPDVELGYRIGRRWWGRGYATEAGRASLEFGFADLGLERIVAVTDPDNRRSQRVLEKLGMTCEGSTTSRGDEALLYVARRPS